MQHRKITKNIFHSLRKFDTLFVKRESRISESVDHHQGCSSF